MATQDKDFKVKNGLQVGGPTNLVNYSSASPSNPFIGQLWIDNQSLYAWSSASTWVLVGDGNSGGPGGEFLTEAAAASVYFPISSSVSNFGTIKTIPATENVVADLITDEVTFAADNGIILNATASVDQLTISTNATWNNTASAIVMRDGVGSFDITSVDFVTTGSGVPITGRLTWDDGEGTLVVGLKGGNVSLEIGQENTALCYNGTVSPIAKGQVVYISSAQGQRPSIALASAISEQGSSKVFGITSEEIASGAEGFVATFGVVPELDTSQFIEGAALWLSASVGKMTMTKPLSPAHLVFVGYCLKVNESSGRIFVNPQNGYELEELHDVLITNASDNDVITYNQSSSLWVNQNLAAAIQEVDGAGSGIDADLLDGFHESYFINTSSATQEKTGNITFHGTVNVENLVITGSAITISSTNLALTDSLIQLAHEQYTTDAVDIGIIGSYGDGTTSSANHYHASFARDASQNKWKLLSNGPAPINNVIDYSDPSVEFGTLQLAAIEVSSSAISTNFNADFLDGYHAEYFQAADTASATYLSKTDASSLYLGINNTALHAQTASSINWSGVTNAPNFLTADAASATYAPLNVVIVSSSASIYTLSITDASELLEFSGSSSVTVVVPLNSAAAFPIGTKIDILQTGVGPVTASYVSGVTLNSAGGRFRLTEQWSAATLIKRGTDSWILIGDLSA